MKNIIIPFLLITYSLPSLADFPDTCRKKIAQQQQINFEKTYAESGQNLRISSPQLYDVSDEFLYKNVSSYFALRDLQPRVEKGDRTYSMFSAYKLFENHFWQSSENSIEVFQVSNSVTRIEFWASSPSYNNRNYYYQAQFSYQLNEKDCSFSNLKILSGREIYEAPAHVPF